MGSHSDWVLDTVFSADGSHLVSVGRDMTAKLTEVATQRFVDNITSITPGALKGGLTAVARHPKRDEIVIGGSDGEPKLYRMFRQTARVIGDDSNLIREFPPLPGRVYSVAVSNDGKRIAAGSSLDGTGEIGVYSYEFDTSYPDKIKAINQKVVTARSPAEAAALEKYHKEGVKQIASVKVPQGGIYAVAFRPDGKVLAAAGADGMIRLLNPETGSTIKEFAAVSVKAASIAQNAPISAVPPKQEESVETEVLPKGTSLVALEVQPKEIRLTQRFAYAQLLVTARLSSGETIDVTRMVEPTLSSAIADISRSGLVQAPGRWQGDAGPPAGGQVRRGAGDRAGRADRAQGRLRPRRRPGTVAARLQLGDLPRLGPGQERLQALAPRLRPDLRRPRLDRRPGGTARQPGLAGRQHDAPEAHRPPCRTSAAP